MINFIISSVIENFRIKMYKYRISYKDTRPIISVAIIRLIIKRNIIGSYRMVNTNKYFLFVNLIK